MFSGSITALVTPFKDDAVDETALEAFVDWQINEGTSGLVPCGTTGESPCLSPAEQKRVVEITVAIAAGRVPVMMGCSSNSTEKAVALAKTARDAGADAVLVVTPYYNKPGPEGQIRHFAAVHDAADLPFYLYNIPGRTGVDVTIDTMAAMREGLANFVGLKDATGDLARVSEQRHVLGKDFTQLSGEDGTALGFNVMGGTGCISVTSNVAPRLCAEFQSASLSGDNAKALELQDRLMPLHWALFSETSPGPVKFAAELLGLCSSDLRLPLTKPGAQTQALIASAISSAGLDPVGL